MDEIEKLIKTTFSNSRKPLQTLAKSKNPKIEQNPKLSLTLAELATLAETPALANSSRNVIEEQYHIYINELAQKGLGCFAGHGATQERGLLDEGVPASPARLLELGKGAECWAGVPTASPVEVAQPSVFAVADTIIARLLALPDDVDPCPGFLSREWRTIRKNAVAAMRAFGDRALEIGWSELDLLGVHPAVGVHRLDHVGALLIFVSPVIRIDARYVTYKNRLRRTRCEIPGATISLLEFAADRGAERADVSERHVLPHHW